MLTHDADPPPLPPPPLTARVALFLDFDGTLADLAASPDAVQVPEAVRTLLAGLDDGLGGAVALVTGRRLADLDQLLESPRRPGAGVHGAELRLRSDEAACLQWQPDTSGLLRGLQAHFGSDPRVLVEDKGVAVALHYRLAPERGGECQEVINALLPVADFEIMRGHQVVEARPRGASKGRALRTLMEQEPFTGRVPVYVGDDQTDEDGFAVAAELGGFGVKVGSGTTLARFRCEDVASVHAWLRGSLGALAAPGH